MFHLWHVDFYKLVWLIIGVAWWFSIMSVFLYFTLDAEDMDVEILNLFSVRFTFDHVNPQLLYIRWREGESNTIDNKGQFYWRNPSGYWDYIGLILWYQIPMDDAVHLLLLPVDAMSRKEPRPKAGIGWPWGTSVDNGWRGTPIAASFHEDNKEDHYVDNMYFPKENQLHW